MDCYVTGAFRSMYDWSVSRMTYLFFIGRGHVCFAGITKKPKIFVIYIYLYVCKSKLLKKNVVAAKKNKDK